jgi:hypothetical protein
LWEAAACFGGHKTWPQWNTSKCIMFAQRLKWGSNLEGLDASCIAVVCQDVAEASI